MSGKYSPGPALRAALPLTAVLRSLSGRRLVRGVRQHHRPVDEERPILVPRDEVADVVAEHVRAVLASPARSSCSPLR